MQLNHDCIRALLIFLEENLQVESNGLSEGIKLRHIVPNDTLSEFSPGDIYYSVTKLAEAKYITLADKNISPKKMIIKEISWEGHEFLDAARNQSNWNKAKTIIKEKGGSITIDVLKQLLIQLLKTSLW